VAYEGMEAIFPKEKIVFTGNPIRAEILATNVDRKAAYTYFGLDERKKTILIIGGSLGARTINESVYTYLDKIKDTGIQLLWQTGKSWDKENKMMGDLLQTAFIDRMDYAYAVADIIIAGWALSYS
jgi:UDP-N-acetylglucosamine--N-acetylmuramyl-(pentapeptide) pyrophosphoryl-undecaprenol N-acetylglucosamine transferase